MSCSLIKSSCTNNIATLVLNRPDKRNALNKIMIATLKNHLLEWSNLPSIRLLIIEAKGDTFCAGADIEWMQEAAAFTLEENIADAQELGQLLECLYHFPSPVVTWVQGAAYGGALGLIAASDIVICTPCAKFCLSEVCLGLIPALISPYLIASIGHRNTKKYALSAEIIDAHRAQAIGLVHDVIPHDDFQRQRTEWIKKLTKGSPEAQAKTKQLLQYVNHKPIDTELIQYTIKAIADARTTLHGQEGTMAFLEKRKPSWIS